MGLATARGGRWPSPASAAEPSKTPPQPFPFPGRRTIRPVLTRDQISDGDKERVAKVNERWLGAQYGDFRGCALNADLLQRRPGVVVVAVEPDKADIVLETLHLINVLIVSRLLADELAGRLL